MKTREEIQALLDEAEAAYHRLITGTTTVSTRDATGRQVTYSQANAAALTAYIAGLKAQLGQRGGYRALRVRF